MTWPLARAALIALIDDTTPTSTKLGIKGSFKYAEEASMAQLPERDRSWWFTLPKRMAISGELTVEGGLPRFIRWDFAFTIVYPLALRFEDLIEVIAADHLALSARVPDANRWGQPASTIQSLYLGAEEICETNLDVVGAKVLATYPLALEFTSASS